MAAVWTVIGLAETGLDKKFPERLAQSSLNDNLEVIHDDLCANTRPSPRTGTLSLLADAQQGSKGVVRAHRMLLIPSCLNRLRDDQAT